MEFLSHILYQAAPSVHFIAFGLLLLAGLNIPVSEDLIIIISASIASSLVPENTVIIFIGCFFGAYMSDIIAYMVGRHFGRRLLRISFFQKALSEEKMKKIELHFAKYGKKTLFFGRFIPFGVRNVLFITAGLIKLRMIKFLVIDFLALLCTSSILFSLGYTFGNNYKVILPYLERYKIIIFILFLMIILFFILKGRFHASRKKIKSDNKKSLNKA